MSRPGRPGAAAVTVGGAGGHRVDHDGPSNGDARDVDRVALAGLDAHGQRHHAGGLLRSSSAVPCCGSPSRWSQE
jgi:hypothetical protein